MSVEMLRMLKGVCEHYGLDEMEARMVCGVEVGVEVGVECGVGVDRSVDVKSVKSVKSEVPLPFNGDVNWSNCVALRKNHGLYTQCENKKEKDVDYCKVCDKKMKKMGSELPEYGTIMLRTEVGQMEYVDPSGGKAIHYTKVMKKLKLTREVVEEEAKKKGIKLEECHFLEEVSKRGRPKGEEKVKKEGKKGRPKKEKNMLEIQEAEETEDLFAMLVLEANKEIAEEALKEESESVEELIVDEAVVDEAVSFEVVVDEVKVPSELEKVVHKAIKDATTKRQAKPVISKEEREAKKEADRLAKEAERLAKKEADRLAKEAEREAKKEVDRIAKEAEREAKKEADRLAKEAKKEADRLAKKEAKAAEKPKTEKPKKSKVVKEVAKVEEVVEEVAKVEEVVVEVAKVEEVVEEVAKVEEVVVEVAKVEEEVNVVKKIKFEGKQYLKSKNSGIIYDYDAYVLTGDQVMVGTWNEEKKCIIFENIFSDSEEEEEEYEEDDC